jgi:hypothetical protein
MEKLGGVRQFAFDAEKNIESGGAGCGNGH